MNAIQQRLARLYDAETVNVCSERIAGLIAKFADPNPGSPNMAASRWTEQDVVLITYGDVIHRDSQTPLEALRQFAQQHGWNELLSTIHILPFCPFSSDDGFSVIDYMQIDPKLGSWDDVTRLREEFRLMFDLVLNHASQQSDWFQRFLACESPYDELFLTADPEIDLSMVVRPRTSPLLTPYETNAGTKHVWTTFSADQVDLNFGSSETLCRMLEILLEYASRGATIIRLDAIAYLWKELGTECIHLPQTHEVVKLMRDVLRETGLPALLLTETNVPHQENVSYFGDQDEADMVYQFSLPPLLLDAMVQGEASPLRDWLAGLAPPPPGCTYFNFTASHDGIGVRPLEGLVSDERLAQLASHVRDLGGRINMRRQEDGSEKPYELNVSYVDAIGGKIEDPAEAANAFLATQAFMLGLQGMPAVYYHSLLGSGNDLEGMQKTGQARTINRRKLTWEEASEQIAASDQRSGIIYQGYAKLLKLRRVLPQFHPDVPQQAIDAGDPRLVAVRRKPSDGDVPIVVLMNVADQPVECSESVVGDCQLDKISGERLVVDCGSLNVPARRTMWLTPSA